MNQPNTIDPAEFNQIKRAIQDINVALLTTQLPNGSLRSRPMITRQLDPDGSMWFFTRNDSSKVDQIRHNPAVALGFSDPQSQRTVTTSGTAEIIEDQRKIDELWDDTVQDWFPEGKDSPNLILLRITTVAGECWE